MKIIHTLTAQLKKSEHVLGILFMGTTGTAKLKPYSDIDVVLLLDSNAPEIKSAVTEYEGMLLDLYTFSETKIQDLLLKKHHLNSNSIEGKLIIWLHSGTVAYDEKQYFNRLQRTYSPKDLIRNTDEELYKAWYGINFNYISNKRYLESQNPTYIKALKLRLLYSIYDLVIAYFKFHNLDWSGEKSAVRYLENNDPKFLDRYLTLLDTNDINTKFMLYEKLAKDVAELYKPMWSSDDIAVLIGDKFSLENVQTAEKLIQQLIK